MSVVAAATQPLRQEEDMVQAMLGAWEPKNLTDHEKQGSACVLGLECIVHLSVPTPVRILSVFYPVFSDDEIENAACPPYLFPSCYLGMHMNT